MKTKNLKRTQVIDFINRIQGIKESHQTQFTGKNIYFVGNDKNEPDFQIEFISKTEKYFQTILIRGLKSEADNMHDEIVNFVNSLQLNKNIVIDTETKISLT